MTASKILSLLMGWILLQHTDAWVTNHPRRVESTALDMAAVGIFYGTSTGSTEEVAEMIYEAFGSDVAAKPVDVDTLEADGTSLAGVFGQHDALVVGTPTWNTGSDTERSGTGWDELYYKQLPLTRETLQGRKVAVFGLGDQVSYAENYADATGELFDVFEGLGCHMMGVWSIAGKGYEHVASKSIRGDNFCGLLLDTVNQEELTEDRVKTWVSQLIAEGMLDEGHAGTETKDVAAVSVAPDLPETTADPTDVLEEQSELLDESIASHSSGG